MVVMRAAWFDGTILLCGEVTCLPRTPAADPCPMGPAPQRFQTVRTIGVKLKLAVHFVP